VGDRIRRLFRRDRGPVEATPVPPAPRTGPELLGHVFTDPGLLERALSHKSLISEGGEDTSNERLEFLGDAVLGLVVAEELHQTFDLAEGEMAKVRAGVVNEATLAAVARAVGLGAHVRLGRGEEASGGRRKASILADALEAVIAAIYLDGGLEAARAAVLDLWRPIIAERSETPGERDYKTRLQEILARDGRVPSYDVAAAGPDHARSFTAIARVDGEVVGRGVGSSKKRAEQDAAKAALGSLGDQDA
jgi:ribonuclease-3